MKKIFVTALCSASVLLGLALYAGQSVKPEMKALYDANVEALSAVEQVGENIYDIGEGKVLCAGMLNKEINGTLLNSCVAGDGICLLSNGKDVNNKVSLYEFVNSRFMEWRQSMTKSVIDLIIKYLALCNSAL